MKALEPIQVIASKKVDPYDYRTRMRWGIVETVMNRDSKGPISCHWVVVRDASTWHVAFFCYEGFHQRHKSAMIKMIYRNDISERAKIMMSKGEVSIEDRKFLHILEKGTAKKVYHYVVPLSFWYENLVMPKNRIQALRRLLSQRKIL